MKIIFIKTLSRIIVAKYLELYDVTECEIQDWYKRARQQQNKENKRVKKEKETDDVIKSRRKKKARLEFESTKVYGRGARRHCKKSGCKCGCIRVDQVDQNTKHKEELAKKKEETKKWLLEYPIGYIIYVYYLNHI